MSIRDIRRRVLSIWTGVIVLGGVMLIGGCTQTLAFLKNVQFYKELTARQLIHELIIPHMVMLCGTGVLVGGVIFMVRRTIIQTRMKHGEV